jgi:hypothetical protein
MNREDFVDIDEWLELRFAPSRALAPGQEAPPNFRWQHEERTLPLEPSTSQPQPEATSTPVVPQTSIPEQDFSASYTYDSIRDSIHDSILTSPAQELQQQPVDSSWDSLLNTSSKEDYQPEESKPKISKPRIRWSEHQETYTVSTYTSSVSSVPGINEVTRQDLVRQAAGATSQEEGGYSSGSSYYSGSSGGESPSEPIKVFQISELLGTDEVKYHVKPEDDKELNTYHAESIGDSDLEELQARAIWGVYRLPPPPGLEACKMDLIEPPKVTNVFREKVHPPARRDTCVMLMDGDILQDQATVVVMDASADLNMPGWDVRRRVLWHHPGLEDLIWKERIKAGRVLKVLGEITEGKLFYVVMTRVKWFHPIGAKELDYFATLKEVFKDIQQNLGEIEIAMTLPSVPSINGRRFQIARCVATAGRGTGLHVRLYQSL